MCALKIQDQGTITLPQMDYLPIVIESFLVDRKSQGLSGETVQFYKKKLNYFAKFCESQVVTQIGQLTPDLLRRYLLELGEQHNPGEVHACFRTLLTLLLWIGQEEIMPIEWKNTYTARFPACLCSSYTSQFGFMVCPLQPSQRPKLGKSPGSLGRPIVLQFLH